MLKALSAFFAAVMLFFSSFSVILSGKNVAEITVDTSKTGDTIPNVVSNVNTWDMGTSFYQINPNEKYNILDFVEYIQLMQCTGGNAGRDLFVDPYDTSTLTDYDFTRLVKNCRGIINAGAKPLLKLGSVPMKYTSGASEGGFQTNVYPPDDYNQYYEYIKAAITALVDEFGADEVRTWRFGCMTEYENSDWFMAKNGKAADSAEEYCKLYDYTVQAIIDVLGDDVCIGAHGMIVTEGLWDEAIFIKHVAQGTNFANGGTGTHIDYLSASFYDAAPGRFTSGKTLPETITSLKKTAEKYGLNDLFYGVDEGRLLTGTPGGQNNELAIRICGDTYQAAYDARLYTIGMRAGLDYFSSWGYLSGGLFSGNPTVSYHVADRISRFAGSASVDTNVTKVASAKTEIDALAGWDDENQTLHLMAYNFKNKVNFSKSAVIDFDISVPQLDGMEVTVTKYVINDDCNYFDEWRADRKKYNITDDMFTWSPDDPTIDSTTTLSDPDARELYFSELYDKYSECAVLTPEIFTATVENGKLTLKETIGGNNVVFYDITAA